MDCMVNFEGRQYSAPFRFARQEVEVRGLAGRVQILKDSNRPVSTRGQAAF